VSDLRDRLRSLAAEASVLEADATRRRDLAAEALAYAEARIGELATGPALPQASPPRPEDLAVRDAPAPLADVIARLTRNVEAGAARPASGKFFAYIPGGNLYEAALADFMASVSGLYSARTSVAAGAVGVENAVIAWLAKVLGMPAGCAGNLASGGSLANLIAIVTAREHARIRAAEIPRSVVYATAQAHHSLAKGLRIAGMGEAVLRDVPVDARFRMDTAALARLVAADRAAGLAPWLLLAAAGTTDTGAVDPLPALADIAARERIWLHVDAAYGGMFALAGATVLAGIARADSVVVDPHKGLFLPWGVGAVLTRHRESMRAAFAFEASYIPDALGGQGPLSPMEVSPELSRPFRGLRVWLPLALLGTRPFAAALEEKLLLAQYAHAQLAADSAFEVGPPPDLSLFLFRPRAASAAERDARTDRLAAALAADGRAAFSPTTLAGERWLRMAILAARTHVREVDDALAILRQVAAGIA
jgi:glutamate/tyrosine decarboxylase-like PLP-dependent enzyme